MKWPRVKLRWQLLFSYLPVILIPVLVIGLVVRNVAEQGLTVLVTQQAQRRAVTVSSLFTQYYTINGSWTGVETLFAELRPSPTFGLRLPLWLQDNPSPGAEPPGRSLRQPQPGQILITDNSGTVVVSDNSNVTGQVLSADALAHGAPLTV